MDSNTNKTLTNSKDIKWSEIEPTVFTDLPEVVKDLDLEEQGAKLMDEQNRMIISDARMCMRYMIFPVVRGKSEGCMVMKTSIS